MKPTSTAGKFVYQDNTLAYQSPAHHWCIGINEIKLIAEYTTTGGPFGDDYFFLFITSPHDGWCRASFYAEGRDMMFDFLAARLGSAVETGLCDFTDFKSRILWPPGLVNLPLGEPNGKGGFILSPAAKAVFKT